MSAETPIGKESVDADVSQVVEESSAASISDITRRASLLGDHRNMCRF